MHWSEMQQKKNEGKKKKKNEKRKYIIFVRNDLAYSHLLEAVQSRYLSHSFA